MSFTEYMYYYGLSPEEWNEDGLEECCLYTLPRKVTADDSDIDLPLVLEGKVISGEEISRMINIVIEITICVNICLSESDI